MTSLAIIDYGSGNVRSVSRALQAAAHGADIDVSISLTDDPAAIARADHVVLPGVGHYADCAAGLRQRRGVIEAMHEAVHVRGRPFLGVCVGMQLLADVGREDVETKGLGWIPGAVTRIQPQGALPVPHIGWNELSDVSHPTLSALGRDAHVYFVHSYAFTDVTTSDVCAVTDYGGRIVAAVARGNVLGVQFHPEKSQAAGQKFLAGFLGWRP